jgi:predicted nucleotidyltransferase
MTPVTQELLQNMVKAIVDEVRPEQIILFGSWARGDARPDSDVDFLVIESGTFSPQRSRRKEMARIWDALDEFVVPTDVLVYSRDEAERWRKSLNHVVGRALREGKVLYERS